MNNYFKKIAALVILLALSIQGCALPNQPYVKKESAEVAPLKVVRYLTPDVRRYSIGQGAAVAIAGSLIFSPFMGLAAFSVYHDIKKVPVDSDIPDYGKLIMDKFTARAKNEIPGWPLMIVEEKPIWEPIKDEINYTLEFKVAALEIKDSKGLRFTTIIAMRDKQDNIIWEKGYQYTSEQFNRSIEYEQLKKDGYKLLKEEMIFAADTTVADFIEHYQSRQSRAAK